ncbi:hypothetical protein BO83DRAFT_171445 [Aspergillus eucalypticola CBS 122712]|uniref:Uncharacterized protein n=1 Tax=Aspergillus eucalypticola (strain CBS 122712 / IBT 29274) TaxID=1448314 RepID=A0A317W7G4_ASPEC|nr:uncharacterized protein BO83DRAFT_171445 [Aspergillus eucalypticola CBS 122712]PWY81192.1 hypothetical protein BO83DRAFT_171445 [Aspergillus eucalypticola CBS 122712]
MSRASTRLGIVTHSGFTNYTQPLLFSGPKLNHRLKIKLETAIPCCQYPPIFHWTSRLYMDFSNPSRTGPDDTSLQRTVTEAKLSCGSAFSVEIQNTGQIHDQYGLLQSRLFPLRRFSLQSSLPWSNSQANDPRQALGGTTPNPGYAASPIRTKLTRRRRPPLPLSDWAPVCPVLLLQPSVRTTMTLPVTGCCICR